MLIGPLTDNGVPDAEIAEGRVSAPKRSDEQLRMYPALVRVHWAPQPAPDAHVAVSYRNHWLWIDDRDVNSRLTFNFLMLPFSLTETAEEKAAAPIVTIPSR